LYRRNVKVLLKESKFGVNFSDANFALTERQQSRQPEGRDTIGTSFTGYCFVNIKKWYSAIAISLCVLCG